MEKRREEKRRVLGEDEEKIKKEMVLEGRKKREGERGEVVECSGIWFGNIISDLLALDLNKVFSMKSIVNSSRSSSIRCFTLEGSGEVRKWSHFPWFSHLALCNLAVKFIIIFKN